MLTHGRNVSYDIPDPELPAISQWIIANPNRVNLGRIGLKYQGETLVEDQILDARQELHVWDGIVTSTFTIDGTPVTVVTQGDFDSDAVVFQIDSDLVSSGDLVVELDFPYPPIHVVEYKYEVFVGSYDFPLNHTTVGKKGCGNPNTAHIYHEMQETRYHVNLRWPGKTPLDLSRDEPGVHAHRFTLAPKKKTSSITFTAHFSQDLQTPDAPAKIQKRNVEGWHEYWNEGGFVDLTASSNPKADELQRRIILSQYHVRVNSASTGQPPQESGLMNNGWYGE